MLSRRGFVLGSAFVAGSVGLDNVSVANAVVGRQPGIARSLDHPDRLSTRGDHGMCKIVACGGGADCILTHHARSVSWPAKLYAFDTDENHGAQSIDKIPSVDRYALSMPEHDEYWERESLFARAESALRRQLSPVVEQLSGTRAPVIIYAALGGCTGTTLSLMIAEACVGHGLPTYVVGALPFPFEGTRRRRLALKYMPLLARTADQVHLVRNDSLVRTWGGESTIKANLAYADDQCVRHARAIMASSNPSL